MGKSLASLIGEHEVLGQHPRVSHLLSVLEGDTYLTPSGYPYICEASFIRFIHRVPHLFENGQDVLDWVSQLKPELGNLEDEAQVASVERALKVVRTMVRTAAVTSPSDLWLLRQILSVHKKLGILDYFLADQVLDPERYAAEHGFNARQLKIDLHFLYSRGYLIYEQPCFLISEDPAVRSYFANVTVLDEAFRTDITGLWMKYFSEQSSEEEVALLTNWLTYDSPHQRAQTAWIPTLREIEIGYRILPITLALRALNLTSQAKKGSTLGHITRVGPKLTALLNAASILEKDTITALGERVLKRGPGPFGIIGTYYAYLNKHEDLLASGKSDIWVSRGENVAASQDANRKTFKMANDALDRFCSDNHYQFKVFIEHAVGMGEATRQRLALSGEDEVRYFGADLEDAAIDEAIKEQQKGHLPKNMQFIRAADIGRPDKITDHLKAEALPSEGAVMIVGNGFHEIRNQSNEEMTAVFRGYQEAGILILFTEETGLSNQDLRATAWNTYHAGFRYVHEMSGQGLRPSWNREYLDKVWSWRRCAEAAGYRIYDEYTCGTRPIYPIKKRGRENPSISETYFCVPEYLVKKLNLPEPESAD